MRWRAGVTPLTRVVWFGQVTVGLTGRTALAIAPLAASLRSVGTGSDGSSIAHAPGSRPG